MKKIKADVQAVTDHLIKQLGGTWQEACVARVAKDSKLVNPPLSPKPWVSTARVAADGSFYGWVKSHLDTKITWM